ncbi:PilZ domain-containing protein [Elusimicrobiota bacterium]
MLNQKRKYNRYYALAFADVISNPKSKKVANVAITNVSMGGLSFLSDVMFFPGETVIFYFSALAIKVAGTIKRVVRSKESFSHGVQFENVTFLNKLILDKTKEDAGSL